MREVLIGSDYYADLVTGRKHCLQNGLVALETSLGWTLTGKLKEPLEKSCGMLVTSMFVADATVTELWNLETIGICDPAERKSREEKETSVKEHFIQTRSEEGRYIVALPWTVESPQIQTTEKLQRKDWCL